MGGLRRSLAWLAMALVAVTATACGDKSDSAKGGQSVRLSIATGGVSGVYYVYGGAYAAVISKVLPGYVATAEVTAASVDNLRLVGAKKSAVAFTMVDMAADAVNGKGAFKQPTPVRALARLYTTYVQVVAADDKIRTIADLKGKRVSVGSPGSGAEVVALRILKSAGINPAKDIKKTGLGIGESASALGDGSIDAFFWTGGLPTPGITELATTHKVHIIPTADFVAPLRKTYGDVYSVSSIPAGAYKGVTAAVPVMGIENLLVVHADMPDDEAYKLTKVLFEHKADLAKVHPEAKNLDLKAAQVTGAVPLHPGAQRYYAEATASPSK